MELVSDEKENIVHNGKEDDDAEAGWRKNKGWNPRFGQNLGFGNIEGSSKPRFMSSPLARKRLSLVGGDGGGD